MLQLLSPERVTIADTEPAQHVEDSVEAMPADDATGGIPPQMSSPTQERLQSIRNVALDLVGETARNVQRLSQTTVEQALEIGQTLSRMQQDLKRKEYSTFLSVLGWASAKARKFINLAKTFSEFETSQLVGIELTTLLTLCSKRYAAVVEQLRSCEKITQQLVERLIKETRSPRKPKQEPISGWKQSPSGGGRYYNVLLHSEKVGQSIERQASDEAILPQRVIEEAVALREQRKSGAVQPNEYYRAQLEELHDVVNNARELEQELRQRDHQISNLESKLREATLASLAMRESLESQVSQQVRNRFEMQEFALKQEIAQLKAQLAAVKPSVPVNEATTTAIPQVRQREQPTEETIGRNQQVESGTDSEEKENLGDVQDAEDIAESAKSPDASLPLESPEFHPLLHPENSLENTHPETFNDASAAFCQSTTASWEQLKLIRDGESYLQTIDTQIQEINSKLSQPGLDRQVERELKGILTNRQKLRLTKISQIVSIASNNGIPADYEMLRTQGRFVLTSEYASNLLRQAKSWSDVVLIVGGDRAQLLQIVQHWTIEEKQLLVHLLITFLETEPDALNEIDWLPQKLLYRALSGLSFTLQKLRQSDNLVDEPELEYLRGCKFESLEKLGTPREHWVFRLGEKLFPMFGRSDFIVEKF